METIIGIARDLRAIGVLFLRLFYQPRFKLSSCGTVAFVLKRYYQRQVVALCVGLFLLQNYIVSPWRALTGESF